MDCLFQGPIIPLFASTMQCFARVFYFLVPFDAIDKWRLCASVYARGNRIPGNGRCASVIYLSVASQGHVFQLSVFSICRDGVMTSCASSFHYGVNSKAILPIFKDIKHLAAVTMKVRSKEWVER